MSLPQTVATDRFDLVQVTAAEVRAIAEGRRNPAWHAEYPRADDVDAVSMIGPSEVGWGPRHVVRRFDGLVIGSIGFFGPPSEGEVEVGYGLVEYARGRGVATESLRALLAQTDGLGVRVRAAVSPENAPSLRVLAKCGFTELRGSNEDGELVLARPVRA